MTAACTWAKRKQREDLKRKLCGLGVGNKTWWSLVNERQVTSHRDTVPLLCRPDGTSATSSGDKTSLSAELFANKMKVDDPGRPPPQLKLETHRNDTTISVTTEQVERLLSAVNVTNAIGRDDVSQRLLKRRDKELSSPLFTVFTSC